MSVKEVNNTSVESFVIVAGFVVFVTAEWFHKLNMFLFSKVLVIVILNVK